jgi:hypothetical protein
MSISEDSLETRKTYCEALTQGGSIAAHQLHSHLVANKVTLTSHLQSFEHISMVVVIRSELGVTSLAVATLDRFGSIRVQVQNIKNCKKVALKALL